MHEREAVREEHKFEQQLSGSAGGVEQREPCPRAAHAALLEEQQMFPSLHPSRSSGFGYVRGRPGLKRSFRGANNQTEARSGIQVQIQNLTAPAANPDESFSLPEFNLHHIFNFQSSSWNSSQLYGDISASGSLPTCITRINS